jgi:hypothetical protein
MTWAMMIERAQDRIERLREKETPTPYDPRHVRLVAEELEPLRAWVGTVHDLDKHAHDLIGQVAQYDECWRLREGDSPVELSWRWTDKVLREKDHNTTPCLWSYKRNHPDMVRDYCAPHGAVTLSLPWWLLASDYEREAALHDLLSRVGAGGVLDARDTLLTSATVSRYGVGPRYHVQAVHAAATHARTDAVVRAWDADKNGQLILWPAVPMPDSAEVASVDVQLARLARGRETVTVTTSARKRRGKDAAAGEGA